MTRSDRPQSRAEHFAAIAGLFAIAITMVLPSAAQAAAWCAQYRGGTLTCGYVSQQQCLSAVSGVEGSCITDPSAGPARDVEPAERRSKAPPAKKTKQATPQKREAPARSPERQAPAKETPAAIAAPPKASPATPAPAPPAAAAPAAAPAAAVDFATARTLVLEGQYEAGLAALRSLGFDDHPEVAAYMGLAHRKLGRVSEARAWYERALRADPNHRLALSFDGMLRAEQNDPVGARRDLEKIKQLCGNETCNEYRALEAVIAATR